MDVITTPIQALEFIRDHVVSVERVGERKLKIKTDKASSANNILHAYHAYYGVNNVSDAEVHFLSVDKYAVFKFRDNSLRERAYDDTTTLISGGSVTVQTVSHEVGGSGTQAVNTATDEVGGGNETATTDTTTYVILGAAAAIIILLLVWKRK